MHVKFTLPPNQITEQLRYRVSPENALPITLSYVDRYTYSWNTHIDTGVEFSIGEYSAFHNVHIGSFCSIGENLNIFIGRTHNMKSISTGAIQLLAQSLNQETHIHNSTFNQKSSVIIQNDVWIGDDVTIMPNVIVHNGACIAKNSHVVNDVPPYAIVGGNPARIIGYRYTSEQINKLLNLQWWYWDIEKIKERFSAFGEDPDVFYENFKEDSLEYNLRNIRSSRENNHYFAFVDYYENYPTYIKIIDSFIKCYSCESSYKLTLFIREEYFDEASNATDTLNELIQLVDSLSNNSDILCTVELLIGTKDIAEHSFKECSTYITNRVYDTVYFSSLADMLGMSIIHGTDSFIQFKKISNITKA